MEGPGTAGSSSLPGALDEEFLLYHYKVRYCICWLASGDSKAAGDHACESKFGLLPSPNKKV